ncbi:hypothetical protein [Caulobacter sp. NIBR1757]|uniref:hypothetical protein n=1 Tax=Caulobacter sp. NIBR1757 TaxID=3016000 RepID=UPI0022F0D7FE|nr:hypothetical protein [Caulobacter sp. NIBR1757]WGM41290.1 hypothetical protein AMEJIAPC_04241 [Caulobacter sp. NIBR1757]
MHRRALLLAVLAVPVASCDLMTPPLLQIVCDPDLVQALERAATAWPGRRGAPVQIDSDISLVELGRKMEALRGGLIATREPKQANRIQRLSLARLEDRWIRDIDGGPVHLVATRGGFQEEHEARKFGKWLATPDADRFADPGAPSAGTAA